MPPTDPTPGELGCYDADHVRRHAPDWKRLLHGYFRAQVHGLDRLPSGPFLAVGNHSGAGLIPDTPLLTLAHDQMFDSFPDPLARWVARYGAIRASRERTIEALRSGCAVQVYPGGDHDACRPFRDRNKVVFAGRTGYVDIAREAGVPIVPVASVGGHETLVILREGQRVARWLGVDRRRRLKSFPLSLSIPWGLWLGPLPGYLPFPARIEIEVAPPIEAHGKTAEIDARVRAILQATIDRLAASRRPFLG